MHDPANLYPQEHVALLRYAIKRAIDILKKQERAPTETQILASCLLSIDHHLLALEMWAVSFTHG